MRSCDAAFELGMTGIYQNATLTLGRHRERKNNCLSINKAAAAPRRLLGPRADQRSASVRLGRSMRQIAGESSALAARHRATLRPPIGDHK